MASLPGPPLITVTLGLPAWAGMVTASEVASADRAGGVSIMTVPGSPALPGGEYVVKALGPSRVTVTFRSSWPAGPGVSM